MMDGSRLLRDILYHFQHVFGESPRAAPEIVIAAHYRERSSKMEQDKGSRIRSDPNTWFRCFGKAWEEWGLEDDPRRKLVLFSTDNHDFMNLTSDPFLQTLQEDHLTTMMLNTNHDAAHWGKHLADVDRHEMRAETFSELLVISMSDFVFKERSGFSGFAVLLAPHLEKKKNVFELVHHYHKTCGGAIGLNLLDAK
eukprot:Trichotokara_eunicae@DN6326_c0_g2_i1.p1